MSTASKPLAMNSYFTKWKGGYKFERRPYRPYSNA